MYPGECIWIEDPTARVKPAIDDPGACVEGTWGQIVVIDMAGMEDPGKMVQGFLRFDPPSLDKGPEKASSEKAKEGMEKAEKDEVPCQGVQPQTARDDWVKQYQKNTMNPGYLKGVS